LTPIDPGRTIRLHQGLACIGVSGLFDFGVEMRIAIFALVVFLLSGCGISAKNVRSDGTAVIELVSTGVYKIDGQLFFDDGVETALMNSRKKGFIKRVDLYVPSDLAASRDPNNSCSHWAGLMMTAGVELHIYSWTPHDENSKRELTCTVVVA
jgi:hypothetical protein